MQVSITVRAFEKKNRESKKKYFSTQQYEINKFYYCRNKRQPNWNHLIMINLFCKSTQNFANENYMTQISFFVTESGQAWMKVSLGRGTKNSFGQNFYFYSSFLLIWYIQVRGMIWKLRLVKSFMQNTIKNWGFNLFWPIPIPWSSQLPKILFAISCSDIK